MRHSANKRLFLLLSLLITVISVMAKPVFRDLKIEVILHDNGDADITEIRQLNIDNEGTEGYIVIGNLEGSEIKNFSVSDEDGEFINEGSWDVDRSRSQKARRCGIVKKSDGLELCWGLGNKNGANTYLIKYTVTGLVRSYYESDGFNWMFITRNMTPSPEMASVTITAPDLEGGLPEDSVKAWAFGFKGEVELGGGEVNVYTTDPMSSEQAMIVLLELPKGMLHPTMSDGGTFEDVRKTAFEGSDYKEYTWYQQFWNDLKSDVESLLLLLFFGLLGVFGIYTGISTRRERKKLLETVDWYREIPVNGNLVRASALYNAFYLSGGIKNEDLISALVLRLVRTGTLRVENRYVAPTGFKKILGREGTMQDCIVIGEFNEKNRLLQTSSLRKLYDIMRQSSGDDLVLQPNELNRWMRAHETEVMDFINSIDNKISKKEARKSIDDVRKVYGLKKFLSDFTLANERHLSEVALWNDYLVYATLYGVADQVMADMKKLNPEYLQLNQIARNLTDRNVVPMLTAATFSSAKSVRQSVESRNRGRGGSSSFGGGGGFRGGGSGGGVR